RRSIEVTASNIATWTIAIALVPLGPAILDVTKATPFSSQSVMTLARTESGVPIAIQAPSKAAKIERLVVPADEVRMNFPPRLTIDSTLSSLVNTLLLCIVGNRGDCQGVYSGTIGLAHSFDHLVDDGAQRLERRYKLQIGSSGART